MKKTNCAMILVPSFGLSSVVPKIAKIFGQLKLEYFGFLFLVYRNSLKGLPGLGCQTREASASMTYRPGVAHCFSWTALAANSSVTMTGNLSLTSVNWLLFLLPRCVETFNLFHLCVLASSF